MPAVPRVLAPELRYQQVETPYRIGGFYSPGLFVDTGIIRDRTMPALLAANCYGSLFTVPEDFVMTKTGVRTATTAVHTLFTATAKIAYYFWDPVDLTHDLIGFTTTDVLAAVDLAYYGNLAITLPRNRLLARFVQFSADQAAGVSVLCESYLGITNYPVGLAFPSNSILEEWREPARGVSIPRTYADPFPAVLSGTHTNLYGGSFTLPTTYMVP